MKLYYFKSEFGNFGDDLNPWLWDRLLPDFFDDDDRALFVGIGTLLNHKIPQKGRKIIVGSGMGYGDKPEVDDQWKFAFVRGPMTAQKLGLDRRLAITDGAVLLKYVDLPRYKKTYKVSFIPHHVSAREGDWARVCRDAGVHYISPELSPDEMFEEMLKSEAIITEAMHGAICADILRVPWVPVVCYDHILEFKWKDWCASMDIAYAPIKLPAIWDQDRHAEGADLMKIQLKRRLRAWHLWNKKWQAPPHREDATSEYLDATKALSDLVDNLYPMMSKDSVLEDRAERAMSRLQKVKRVYTRENANDKADAL